MFDIKPPREELRVFTKKAMGRKYVWAGDLQVAREFCDRHGFSLVLSDAQYQIAKIIGHGVKLVIYPHTTTSTRNQHLRVRNEGGANPELAQLTMAALNRAAGGHCTFSNHWTVNPVAHRLRWDWNTDVDALLAAEIKGGKPHDH